MNLYLLSTLTAGLLLPATAAEYHAPNKQAEFDITAIPLDVDRLETLSTQLTQIASRQHNKKDAVALRTNAALIYLALQVNPNNKVAQHLNQTYLKSKHHHGVSVNEVKKITQEILQFTNALERQSHNKDSQKLVMLIKDAILQFNHSHPALIQHQFNENRWKDVLPPIASYRKGDKPPVVKKNPNPTQTSNTFLQIDLNNKSKGIRDNRGSKPSKITGVDWANSDGKESVAFTKNGYIEFKKIGNFDRNLALTAELMIHTKAKNFGSIISHMNAKQSHRGWDIWLQSGHLCFELNHSFPQSSIKVYTKHPIPVNKWTHLAVSYDGSSKAGGVSLYVNGVKQQVKIEKDSLNNTIQTNVRLRIGNRYHGDMPLGDFKLSHVAFHRGVLSNKAIAAHAKNQGQHQQHIPTPPKKTSIGHLILPEGELKLHQRNFTILSPMMQTRGRKNKETKTTLAKVSFQVKHGSKDHEIEFELHPDKDRMDFLRNSQKSINESIKKTFGKVGKTKLVMKTVHAYSPSNAHSISGPIAVAIGASLANKPVPEGTTVCAEIDHAANLRKPQHFWTQLDGLTKSSKPHRIIAGKGSEIDFKQILVRRNPSFFLLNEVIIVNNLTEGVEAATLANPTLEKASKIFAEIQKVSLTNDHKKVLTNTAIKQKLNEVLKLAPNHLSAKLLLLWSSAERPAHYDSLFATQQLHKILKKYSSLRHKDLEGINEDQLETLAKEVAEELEEHRLYFTGEHKKIYIQMKESTETMEVIAQSIRNGSGLRKRTAETKLVELKTDIKQGRLKLIELLKK